MNYRQIQTRPPSRYNFPKTSFDFVFLAVAKCASTAIRNAMDEWRTTKGAITLEEAEQYGTRLTVIRHPFNRLVSAWRHLAPHLTWAEFVPYALERRDRDLYFAPFAEKVQAATTVLTLENLAVTWPQFQRDHDWLPPRLMVTNTAEERNQSDLQPTDTFDDLILAAYGADVILWREVFVKERTTPVTAVVERV